MIHKLIDKTLNLLFFCMFAIIITGGGIFRFGKVKLEFASLSAWAAAFVAFSLLGLKVFKMPKLEAHERINKLIQKLQNPRYFWGLLTFFGLTLLVGHLFRHWSLNTDG